MIVRIQSIITILFSLFVAEPSLLTAQSSPDQEAPYLNTWLVSGPIDQSFTPSKATLGGVSHAGKKWEYFDDRLCALILAHIRQARRMARR